MKNPLRNRILANRPIWSVQKALESLSTLAVHVTPDSTDPLLWQEVRDRALFFEEQARESPYAQPDDARPAVRAPAVVPAIYPAPSFSFIASLEAVGTVRGIHLATDSRGGYSLTVKLTLQNGGRVYRFGRLQRADQLEEVIAKWLAKGYWTPDRQ